VPGAEVRLWPNRLDGGVRELLQGRFPKLQIVEGRAALDTAFDECDALLHGSGASLVAEKDVVRWADETGKPYGVYGITLPLQASTATGPRTAEAFRRTVDVLSAARFVFFRDSVSLQVAKDHGCACPVMEFGPDAAFGTDLRDDAKATAFLKSNGLEAGRFLCCIPRLRYTPYWLVPSKRAPFDEKKQARNEARKEHDHAPLRQAIVEVVRQTSLKVLICPEDQTQMAVGKELLFDPLPADVRPRVVWRPDYTSEAPVCSATRCTRRSCASPTAFRRSSAGSPSRRARASCGATSAWATGCSTSTAKPTCGGSSRPSSPWRPTPSPPAPRPSGPARSSSDANEIRWRS